jgi:hypothetical protein
MMHSYSLKFDTDADLDSKRRLAEERDKQINAAVTIQSAFMEHTSQLWKEYWAKRCEQLSRDRVPMNEDQLAFSPEEEIDVDNQLEDTLDLDNTSELDNNVDDVDYYEMDGEPHNCDDMPDNEGYGIFDMHNMIITFIHDISRHSAMCYVLCSF